MALYVQAPARQPRSGGIKDVVGEFINEPRLSAAQGGIVWEAQGCSFPKATRAGCYDTITQEVDPKTTEGIDIPEAIGPAFARYAGVECYLGGDDGAEGSYSAQATALLEQGEDREIEAVLWTWAAAAASPTEEASLVLALARAEEFADTAYVGRPVILVSRYVADQLFAAGALTRDSGKLVTPLGNPVIASGAASEGDEGKIIAIGQPAVYASPTLALNAPAWGTNRDMAIAERIYAIGVDCDFRHVVTVAPETP